MCGQVDEMGRCGLCSAVWMVRFGGHAPPAYVHDDSLANEDVVDLQRRVALCLVMQGAFSCAVQMNGIKQEKQVLRACPQHHVASPQAEFSHGLTSDYVQTRLFYYFLRLHAHAASHHCHAYDAIPPYEARSGHSSATPEGRAGNIPLHKANAVTSTAVIQGSARLQCRRKRPRPREFSHLTNECFAHCA